MEVLLASVMGVAVLGGALAARPLGRWVRKVKRRKGGVYLWRVRHHRNPMRRVNGYVGETNSFHFRKRQHLGSSNYAPAGGKRLATAVKVPAQSWSDLDPVMHKIISLPWWLCWKWVLRPLETLVMLCTWPVYNDAKNHWNPRRITKSLAKAQRAARDAGGNWMVTARNTGARALGIALQVTAVLLIMGGLIGWMITR
jgi:hypothetical protein